MRMFDQTYWKHYYEQFNYLLKINVHCLGELFMEFWIFIGYCYLNNSTHSYTIIYQYFFILKESDLVFY